MSYVSYNVGVSVPFPEKGVSISTANSASHASKVGNLCYSAFTESQMDPTEDRKHWLTGTAHS